MADSVQETFSFRVWTAATRLGMASARVWQFGNVPNGKNVRCDKCNIEKMTLVPMILVRIQGASVSTSRVWLLMKYHVWGYTKPTFFLYRSSIIPSSGRERKSSRQALRLSVRSADGYELYITVGHFSPKAFKVWQGIIGPIMPR